MWFYDKISIFIPLSEAIVTLFVIANFSLATFMDAGVIPKGIFHGSNIISLFALLIERL